MLVLKLLIHEEKYGYQLINELGKYSNGMFSLKEGTLYPILYRLEDEGSVVSRWSEARGKEVSRKYYSISDTGKQTLSELKELWSNFSENVRSIMEEV